MTPDPADSHEEPAEHAELPPDPFDDDAVLASGPDDVGFLRPPSRPSRLLSTFIDMFVAYFLVVVIDTVIIILAIHPGKKLTAAQSYHESVIFNLVLPLVLLIFVALERWTRGSLGHRLLHLRLVQLNGQRPTGGKLLIRYGLMFGLLLLPFGTLIGLFAIAFLIMGYAWVRPDRRSVFDLAAGTRVVAESA